MSFAVVLFFIFLALKLAGLVAWPWMWVFAPLWVALMIWVLAVLIMAAKDV